MIVVWRERDGDVMMRLRKPLGWLRETKVLPMVNVVWRLTV